MENLPILSKTAKKEQAVWKLPANRRFLKKSWQILIFSLKLVENIPYKLTLMSKIIY